MEAELLGMILKGGGATGGIWFLYHLYKELKSSVADLKKEGRETIVRVERMHFEGMAKIDKAIDTVNALATTLAVHAKEIEHGDKRVVKVEDEQAMQRKSMHDFRNSLHEIRNVMVTKSEIRELIKG